MSAAGNFGGGAPTGGGPRTEYVTRARRRREAEAQELATQEREEGPAKKNYGGEHIGNQREQAANVVRKHILNGGVGEGERHWAYPEKRWPLKLEGIIQQKQQGAKASQAGFQGAFMASSFRPQEFVGSPESSRLRDHQHRLDRAATTSSLSSTRSTSRTSPRSRPTRCPRPSSSSIPSTTFRTRPRMATPLPSAS